MLDLLLINPGGRPRIYQSLATDLSAIETPVWAGLMASYVRAKGFTVDILDTNAEGLDPEAAALEAARRKPRLHAVVVYGQQPSASTQVMTPASELCGALKEASPEIPVILVGGHAAALPQRTLEEEKADFVAGGEGLQTLTGLLEALKSSSPRLDKVPSLWYRREGTAVQSLSQAALVRNLDQEMPGVAWDLIPVPKYRAHNWHAYGEPSRYPYAAVYTTLGCPYHCSFCCIQAPFKEGEKAEGLDGGSNSYRYWSPTRVVDDLEMLAVKHGVRNVKFADEMFVLTRGHVNAICDKLVERGLKLNIWAYARVDTVRSDAMLDKLAAAGFRWLAFGIESANAKVRDDVQKGYDQADIVKALDRVRSRGISVIGNYIFGLPEDDHNTMKETLDLALDLNCEFANFYCAMAYPGSPLYLQAQKEGWRLPDSWLGYSQHAFESLPLPTKHLSAGEVLGFRDKAFVTYFKSPRYLDMVGRKFGPGVLAEIQGMLAHNLRRKHAA